MILYHKSNLFFLDYCCCFWTIILLKKLKIVKVELCKPNCSYGKVSHALKEFLRFNLFLPKIKYKLKTCFHIKIYNYTQYQTNVTIYLLQICLVICNLKNLRYQIKIMNVQNLKECYLKLLPLDKIKIFTGNSTRDN